MDGLTLEALRKARKHFEDLDDYDMKTRLSSSEYNDIMSKRNNPFEVITERKRTRHLFGFTL